jgi:predicted anti-sigma-YlaC factor YlaD
MKQHFTEADLLETYYMKPGESMPVMMHLADCPDCAARYERLERKMRSLHECSHQEKHAEKPESFWTRQRMQILRKIDARRERRSSLPRFAAAAVVALAITGAVTWKAVDGSSSRRVVETVAAPASLDDPTPRKLDDSPWQSDELNDYSSMVAWESWVEEGDRS